MTVEDVNEVEIKEGDKVKAVEDVVIFGPDEIDEGEELIVDFIRDGKIFFTTIPDQYGGFEGEYFEKI